MLNLLLILQQFISVNVENSVAVVGTRALSDAEQEALIENCSIKIYDNGGSLVRSYEGIKSVPDPLTLLVGNYSVVITAGESVPASTDKKFYKGTETFAITKSQSTDVIVKCNIANTLANVIFDTETRLSLASYLFWFLLLYPLPSM